jgi:hypothetical protein
MNPEWDFTYFVIQTIGGFFGAHGAALVAHEHRFGFIGHSLVGLIAGALSGLFLQRVVMTTVTGTGDTMPIDAVQAGFYQAVAGLAAGGIAMLVIGFLRYEMTKKSTD